MPSYSDILILLAVLMITQMPVKAQFYVSYDVGLVKYNVDIEYFGDNNYEKTTPDLINVGVLYKSENYRWNVDLSSQKSRLRPAIKGIDYYDTHFVDASHHELGIEYLKKVENPSDRLNIFLGLGYKAQSSTYTKRIQSKFLESTADFEESVVFDLSLLGAVAYRVNNKLIYAKVGVGVLNYRHTREENWYKEKEYYGIGPNLVFQLESEIYVQIPVAPRVFLKPEYSFRYYKYKDYSEMRVLHQYFLLGGVFQL